MTALCHEGNKSFHKIVLITASKMDIFATRWCVNIVVLQQQHAIAYEGMDRRQQKDH